MSDPAPRDGAQEQPPVEQPVAPPQQRQPIPIPITDTDVTNELERVLTSTTFVIEKKLSTVAQQGASVESAYLAEDETKKEPYNLIIKIDTVSGDLGKKIQDDIRIGKNYKLKLEPTSGLADDTQNTKYFYIPITYTVSTPNTTNTTSTTIYIYCITNVKVNGMDGVSVKEIFMIEAKREKTGKGETFKTWAPFTAKYTATVSQALPELEKEILDLLKKLIPVPTIGGDKTIETKNIELSKLWKISVPIITSDSKKAAAQEILTVFKVGLLSTSYLDTVIPSATQLDDTLMRTIKNYTGAIAADEIPFRLRMKRTASFPVVKYDADYDIKHYSYKVREQLLYHLINLYDKVKSYINEGSNYETLKTETGLTVEKSKFDSYMEYLIKLHNAFPMANKGTGVSKLITRTLNPFTFGKAIGGSIKYQQKRYKVYEREDGAKYITLDKKKYTLKMSSKGTYITRDGKRQYL